MRLAIGLDEVGDTLNEMLAGNKHPHQTHFRDSDLSADHEQGDTVHQSPINRDHPVIFAIRQMPQGIANDATTLKYGR